MKQLLVFGLILVALSACKQIDVDKELVQIDSLKTVINSADTILNEVDIQQVKSLQEQMNNQIMLAKSMYGDSIDWENAKLLSRYYGINKTFKKYIEKEQYLIGELEFSHKQLLDLSSDLQSNIFSVDTFNIYFEKECKAVTELKDLIQQEVNKTKTGLTDYEEHSSKIKELLEKQEIN